MQCYKEVPSANNNSNIITTDGNGNFNDIEMNEKILTASSIVRTIVTLIINLDTAPEVLIQMESSIIPVVIFTLENEIIGNFPLPRNGSIETDSILDIYINMIIH